MTMYQPVKTFVWGSYVFNVALFTRYISIYCYLYASRLNRLWNFTKVSSKEKLCSLNPSFKITNFEPSKKSKEIEIYLDSHALDFWTTNTRHSMAVTCLKVIQSTPKLSCYAAFRCWRLEIRFGTFSLSSLTQFITSN